MVEEIFPPLGRVPSSNFHSHNSDHHRHALWKFEEFRPPSAGIVNAEQCAFARG